MVINENRFASGLFNLLTQRRFNLKNYHPDEISIRTQIFTNSGRPDIEIVVPDYLINIENKVEAPLDKNQIERYRSDLESSDSTNTLLVVISRHRMKFQEEPDVHIRWFQIAKWLDKSINRLKSQESFTRVSHFLEFLRYRYLATDPATTRVAPSLKKFFQREGKESLNSRYITRSSRLGNDHDLIPLRKELNVMAFSIEMTFPNDSFGFSNRQWGLTEERTGLGFGIEYRYDFLIDINHSDIILFRAPMRRKLSSSAELGHGKLLKIAHLVFWIAKLKIIGKDISFFTKSFDQQVSLLSNFLKRSRAIVDKLDP